jgi:hypothetical protein
MMCQSCPRTPVSDVLGLYTCPAYPAWAALDRAFLIEVSGTSPAMPGLTRLVAEIHRGGAKAAIQLGHGRVHKMVFRLPAPGCACSIAMRRSYSQ